MQAKIYYNQAVNPPSRSSFNNLIFKSIGRNKKRHKIKLIKNPVGGHFTYGREGTLNNICFTKNVEKN